MKRIFFTTAILLLVTLCFAQDNSTSYEVTQTIKKGGIGLGSAIAVAISWDKNKSILYAIIHGLLSWLYVIYFALTREK